MLDVNEDRALVKMSGKREESRFGLSTEAGILVRIPVLL